MPTILWFRREGRNEVADQIENLTGLKVEVHSVFPAGWENLKSRIRLLVVEPPVQGQVLQQCLSEAQNTRAPIHTVVYDPESILDERLIAAPFGDFRHVTEHLAPSEFAKLIGHELERAAQLVWQAAANKEPWRDLLIGESRPMQLLHSMIRLVGPRRSTVLITGETGTGKELVARAIHMASPRAGSRMVSVNCAAIPENLFESELFGHAKGAFTGAVNDRVGRFEQAQRSTIFLDEVGEVPLGVQPKLLRVLQEREIQRVGGHADIPIDTRVISASNIDLERAVTENRFREDLLYRLNVVPIVVPPLRERLSDVPLLADHFIEKICRREGFRIKTLSADAVRRLSGHEWPGNVRQLEHAIEMAVTLSGERARLYAGDIRIPEPKFNSAAGVQEIGAECIASAAALPGASPNGSLNLEQMVSRVEQFLIQEALRQCGGNKAKAASSLGIPRTTLVYKLRSLEACA